MKADRGLTIERMVELGRVSWSGFYRFHEDGQAGPDPEHLGSRDRYIGWNAEARRRNIRFLAYNTRFLILPWVAVPLLASRILSRMARRLSPEWERAYGHPIYFLETFVDPEQFRGT